MNRHTRAMVFIGVLVAAISALAAPPKVGELSMGMPPQQSHDVLAKRGLTTPHGNNRAEITYALKNGQSAVLPESMHVPGRTYISKATSNSDGETVLVFFTPLFGQERLVKVQRSLGLGPPGTNPTADSVLRQLEDTYGKPTHSYRDGPAKASLSWRWDSNGVLQPTQRVVHPCLGNAGTSSTRDDPSAQCGSLALTVTLQEGLGPGGPGVSFIESVLVDYSAIRAAEVEVNKRIAADQKRLEASPPPKTNLKL